MLVLTRQRDEVIRIGDDIEITVVDIRGDKVRIGITAPKDVPVHRDEVYQAIRAEKAAEMVASARGKIEIQTGHHRPGNCIAIGPSGNEAVKVNGVTLSPGQVFTLHADGSQTVEDAERWDGLS